MADINKEASWVTARLLEVGNATNDGTNILITDANIQYYNAGGLANTLPITQGGTNATTAADARTNLGVPSTGDVTSAINTAVAPKADKVTGATSGNFAGLDANGDLTDSGSKASDFIPALASGVTPGDIAVIGSNNNIEDGGHKFSDAFPVGSASGAVATFSDGADGIPIKSMTVQIEPRQAGTGDPSPSNVRAITGWTSANVTRAGKNLVGGYKFAENIKRYVPLAVIDTDEKTVSFAAANGTNTVLPFFGMAQIPFKPNTQYTFIMTFEKSSGTSASQSNMRIYYTDNTYTDIPNVSAVNTKQTTVVTSTAGKTVLTLNKRNALGTNKLYYDECGVFEGVLTASDFEPYNGNTYTIEFPSEAGTVYGGELTVAEDGSGTLVSDWRYARLQGTVTQYPGTGYELMYYMTGWQDGKIHINGNGASYEASYRMCNMLKSVPNVANARTDRGTFSFAEGSSTAVNRFYGVYPDGVTSASEMSTWLTNNEVYIAYKLQTPAVYQLTAPQVSTLLGLNNIWADTGDIAVEYHADPTIFVSEKTEAIKKTIAYLQDDFTAVQPYVVNDLVYVGDTLYIVTSQIAQGATMTPNTNCAETTLNAVIKSLR